MINKRRVEPALPPGTQSVTARPAAVDRVDAYPHVQVSKIDADVPAKHPADQRYDLGSQGRRRGGGMVGGRYLNVYISDSAAAVNTLIAAGVVVGGIVLVMAACIVCQYCKQRNGRRQRPSTADDDNNNDNVNVSRGRADCMTRASEEGEELGMVRTPEAGRGDVGSVSDDGHRNTATPLSGGCVAGLASPPSVGGDVRCDDDSVFVERRVRCWEHDQHPEAGDAAAATTSPSSTGARSTGGNSSISTSDVSADTLQYDDDSYQAQVLGCCDTNPDLSAFPEDVSAYITGLGLAMYPRSEETVDVVGMKNQTRTSPGDEHEPSNSNNNSNSNSNNNSNSGSGYSSRSSLRSDESLSHFQNVKAQPQFSPYHLAWVTPHLPPVRNTRQTSASKSLCLDDSESTSPQPTPVPRAAPRSHRGPGLGREVLERSSAASLEGRSWAKRPQAIELTASPTLSVHQVTVPGSTPETGVKLASYPQCPVRPGTSEAPAAPDSQVVDSDKEHVEDQQQNVILTESVLSEPVHADDVSTVSQQSPSGFPATNSLNFFCTPVSVIKDAAISPVFPFDLTGLGKVSSTPYPNTVSDTSTRISLQKKQLIVRAKKHVPAVSGDAAVEASVNGETADSHEGREAASMNITGQTARDRPESLDVARTDRTYVLPRPDAVLSAQQAVHDSVRSSDSSSCSGKGTPNKQQDLNHGSSPFQTVSGPAVRVTSSASASPTHTLVSSAASIHTTATSTTTELSVIADTLATTSTQRDVNNTVLKNPEETDLLELSPVQVPSARLQPSGADPKPTAGAPPSPPRDSQPQPQPPKARHVPGVKSTGKVLTNRLSLSVVALRNSSALSRLAAPHALHDSLVDLVGRCSLAREGSTPGASRSRLSTLDDSLAWDCFPFRGAEESLLWSEDDQGLATP